MFHLFAWLDLFSGQWRFYELQPESLKARFISQPQLLTWWQNYSLYVTFSAMPLVVMY